MFEREHAYVQLGTFDIHSNSFNGSAMETKQNCWLNYGFKVDTTKNVQKINIILIMLISIDQS